LAGGDVEGAFARLVDTVRRTAGEERTAAREHLIELFSLFPPDDPQVIKARRALAAALY
ncbi:MAG: tetratricopeptide repeat protein, partial [Nakamurella sp.]